MQFFKPRVRPQVNIGRTPKTGEKRAGIFAGLGITLAFFGAFAGEAKAQTTFAGFGSGSGGASVTSAVAPSVSPAGSAQIAPIATGGGGGAASVSPDGLRAPSNFTTSVQEKCTGGEACDNPAVGGGPEPEISPYAVAGAAATFALANGVHFVSPDNTFVADAGGRAGANVASMNASALYGQDITATSAGDAAFCAITNSANPIVDIRLGRSDLDRKLAGAIALGLTVVNEPPHWAVAVNGALNAYTAYNMGDSTRKVVYLLRGDKYVEYTLVEPGDDGYPTAGSTYTVPLNTAILLETPYGPAFISRNAPDSRFAGTARFDANAAATAWLRTHGGISLTGHDGRPIGCHEAVGDYPGSVQFFNTLTADDDSGIRLLDGVANAQSQSFGNAGTLYLFPSIVPERFNLTLGESRKYEVRSVTVFIPQGGSITVDGCDLCKADHIDLTMTHGDRTEKLRVEIEYRDGKIYQTGYRRLNANGEPTGDLLQADALGLTDYQFGLIDEVVDARIVQIEAVQDALAQLDNSDLVTTGLINTDPAIEVARLVETGTRSDGIATLKETVTALDGNTYYFSANYGTGKNHVANGKPPLSISLSREVDGSVNTVVYTRNAAGDYVAADGTKLETVLGADCIEKEVEAIFAQGELAPAPRSMVRSQLRAPAPDAAPVAAAAPLTLASIRLVPDAADGVDGPCNTFVLTMSNGLHKYVRATFDQDTGNYHLTFSDTVNGTYGNEKIIIASADTVGASPDIAALRAIGAAAGVESHQAQLDAGRLIVGGGGGAADTLNIGVREATGVNGCAGGNCPNADGGAGTGAGGSNAGAADPTAGQTAGATLLGADLTAALAPVNEGAQSFDEVSGKALQFIDAPITPAAKAGLEALLGLALAGMGLITGRVRKKEARWRLTKVVAGEKGSKLADAMRGTLFLGMPTCMGLGGGLLGLATVTAVGVSLANPISAAIIGSATLVGSGIGLMNAFGSNFNNTVGKKYKLSGFPAGTGKTAAQQVAEIRRDVLGSLAKKVIPNDKTAAELYQSGNIDSLEFAILRWKEHNPDAYHALISKKPEDAPVAGGPPAPKRDGAVPRAKGTKAGPVDLVAKIEALEGRGELEKKLAIAMLKGGKESLKNIVTEAKERAVRGTNEEQIAALVGAAIQIAGQQAWQFGKSKGYFRFRQGRIRDLHKLVPAEAYQEFKRERLANDLGVMLERVGKNPKVELAGAKSAPVVA